MLLNLSILFGFLLLLIFSISKWKIHPFIALILTALGLGLSMGLGGVQTVEVLLKGFSETLRWIAVIIILGAFIGEVLQVTGGAFRIANKIISWVGMKKLPWAMGITGYIVSIPVFVDVAYIILHPITESLSLKSKKPVLYVGLALTAGLTVAHTLIPPTPGPLAVASLLELELGRMIIINLFVGSFAMIGGILWVIFRVKNLYLDIDTELREKTNHQEDIELEYQKGSFILDMLPILIPIILIALGPFLESDSNSSIAEIIRFVSQPMIAVMVGAFIAVFQIKGGDRKSTLNDLVEKAILKSALVIMITGAGGALGFVIKQTSIQNDIINVFSQFPFLGFILPFVVASLLTISTGSITVSLVGSASMLAPMVGDLPVSPELVAALIGSGAFCVFHANSSFFWLLNRLHKAPPNVLYKSYTMQSLVMGLSGLLAVSILYLSGIA